MKLYSIADVAKARGTHRMSAQLLSKRHKLGRKIGNTIVFTQQEFDQLCAIPDWNKYKIVS